MAARLTVPLAVLIPTARPTFAVDAARERVAAARGLLADLGARVVGPPDLVLTPDDAEAAAPYVDANADLVVHVCATFSDASPALRLYRDLDRPVLLWAFREPGPVGDRLWLNSLCGANLFGHALVRAGGTVRLVYGDPEEPEVREVLARALGGELPPAPTLPTAQGPRDDADGARAGLAALRGRRIGLVGEAPGGFTPCDYDPALVEGFFGSRLERLDVDAMLDRAGTVSDTDRDDELRDACAAQPSLRDLDPDQVERAAAVTAAMRTWVTEQRLDALAVRCWPEFPTRLGACPCGSLSRLADAGTVTACERDVYGALTMLLLEALGAGTTYLTDTVDLDAGANLVRFWHCGSAATALAADPRAATQDVHCNRRVAVAGNFPLRRGPVIVSRLAEDPADPSRPRLLIAAGESVPAPNRFQGNTADVRLDAPATELVHGLVTAGFPHHTVLAWTDVRPRLRAAADASGIPVIEW